MSTTLRSLIVRIGADWSDAQKNLKQAAKELKSAGKEMVSVGQTLTKSLTVPIAGVAAGMAAMTISAGKAADELITLSNKTGISTDQLQEMEYAARFIDVELETMTSSMIKLTKNMDNARRGTLEQKEAFEALNVEYKNADGTLRNAKDVWRDVINALGDMASEADRDAYALRLFGRSAAELNPLIVAGGDALDYYAQEAHDMGAVVSEESVTALGAFDDQMQQLQAVFKAAKSEIGAAFLPVFERLKPIIENKIIPAIKGLASWIGRVVEWFSELSPATQKMIGLAVGLAAAIGPLITIVGKVTLAISALASHAAAASAAMGAGKGLTGALTAFMGPAGAIALGIAALTVVIGAAVITYNQAKQAVEGMTEETKALITVCDDSKKAFEDQNALMDANAKLAEDLTNELFELNERENKSAEDKAKMASIVARLNTMYEGLNLSIDETTGLLTEEKEAVRELLRQRENEIRLAAYAEHWKTLMQEQIELDQERKRLIEEMTGAQYGAYSEAVLFAQYQKQLTEGMIGPNQELVNSYIAIDEQLKLNKATQAEVVDQYESMKKAVDETNSALKEQQEQRAQEQLDLTAAAAAYEEYLKRLEDRTDAYIDQMGGFYDKAKELNKTSAAEVQKNLEEQTRQFRTWTEEIKKLAPEVPRALLDELMEIGPESTKLIQDLNKMTPEQLEDFVKAWEDKAKAAKEAATFELSGEGGLVEEVKDAAAQVAAALDQNTEIENEAKALGSAIISGMQSGMNAKLPSLLSTARNLARQVVSSMKKELQIASPSKVTLSFGRYLSEGLALGIGQKAKDALSEARGLTAGVLSSFKSGSLAMPGFSTPIPADGPELSGSSGSERIGQEIIRAIRESKAAGGKQEIIVNLNAREFARAIYPDIDREAQARSTYIGRGRGV